ncbi:MAG: EamA family transporter, partial [Chloroflexi bacterium]|nr:EamA family transporter [Chloroflexota bacterium]
ALGAARTSMITYVIPVVGLLLGVLFLDEQIDGRLLIGTLLIVGGIALVNLTFATVSSSLRARLAGRANVIRSPTDLP